MRRLVKLLVLLAVLLPVGGVVVLALPEMGTLLAERRYWLGYANSLLLTAPTVAFQLAVAAPAAFALARWRGRMWHGVYLLYCLLTLMPCQVMLLPNYLVCRALKLLNMPLSVILLGIFSPLSVFLLARQMQKIGREQAEAAALDGAGNWSIFRSIYLPQVKDTLWIAAGLAFLDCWSMVELPLVLLSDQGRQPLSILLAQPDFAAPYAGAVAYMAPIVAAVLAAAPRLGRRR